MFTFDKAVYPGLTASSGSEQNEAALYEIFCSTQSALALGTSADQGAQLESIFQLQFRARQQQYQAQYPDSVNLLLKIDQCPIGNLWFETSAESLRIVDIRIRPEYQCRGIGRAVIGHLITKASKMQVVMKLSVQMTNPAIHLYRQLGFSDVDNDGVYLNMTKLPDLYGSKIRETIPLHQLNEESYIMHSSFGPTGTRNRSRSPVTALFNRCICWISIGSSGPRKSKENGFLLLLSSNRTSKGFTCINSSATCPPSPSAMLNDCCKQGSKSSMVTSLKSIMLLIQLVMSAGPSLIFPAESFAAEPSNGNTPLVMTNVEINANRISVVNGRLSVSGHIATRIELLRQIGKLVNFEVVVIGNLEQESSVFNFTRVELEKAVKKILADDSTIISYRNDKPASERSIAKIYILGNSLTGSSSTFRIDAVELNVASQNLIDTISTREPTERIEAIDRVEGFSDKDTVAALVFSLRNDPDESVRSRAVTAITKLGGSVAVTALEHGLGDEAASIRSQIVKSLATLEDEKIVFWLGQLLMSDPGIEVRLQAVHALSKKSGITVRQFLEVATSDESPAVIRAARQYLDMQQHE